jgi:hypothetical protein
MKIQSRKTGVKGASALFNPSTAYFAQVHHDRNRPELFVDELLQTRPPAVFTLISLRGVQIVHKACREYVEGFNRSAPFKPFNKANVPIKGSIAGFVTAGSIVQAVYESKRSTSLSVKLMSI